MAEPKKLKFVEAFNAARGFRSIPMQSGYEKIDSDRVLERYFAPISYELYGEGAKAYAMTTTVFDFKSFTATVTTQQVSQRLEPLTEPAAAIIPFSAFENKMAIEDAHQALTELGGAPAPIEDLLDRSLTTKRAITPLKPPNFGPKKAP